MNYKIIKDYKEVERFIKWLPELEDGQKFYISLFARKKYGATQGLKADKGQLKRFTASKEQMINKIKKLEVELGSYECDGIPVNQDSLVLYITPNPRDMHKAGLKTIQELTKFLVEGKKIYNAQSTALNMIQVSGIKKYFDMDIDFKDGKSCTLSVLYDWLWGNDIINKEAVVGNIVKTRGGFHVLVELDKITDQYKKKWYNNFSNTKSELFTVMVNSDNMIPFPGCVQSDYSPKLV